MATDTAANVIPDSTYPALQLPKEPQSQIPPYLLEGASPADKYIMEQISILRQHNEWAVNAAMTHDLNIRTTNGRLRKAEAEIGELGDSRRSIVRGWRFLLAVAAGLSGLISFIVMLYQAANGTAR